MTRRFDHNVIIVAIADSENISGHAVACAGSRKIVYSSLVLEWRRIVLSQPISNRPVLERAGKSVFDLNTNESGDEGFIQAQTSPDIIPYLDPSQRLGARHELHKSPSRSCRDAAKSDHLQIKSVLAPQFIHDPDLMFKRLDLVTRQGGTKKLKIPYHLKGEHVLSQIVSHFVHGANQRILIHCANPKSTMHKTFPVHYNCKMVNITFRLGRMES